MQGHLSATGRSYRVSQSLFWRVCISPFTLKQRVPPGAAPSPAAAPVPAACSAPACPPATAGGARWWQTSGCRGSLWTLQTRTRVSANTGLRATMSAMGHVLGQRKRIRIHPSPRQELRCWMLPVHHMQEIRACMDQTHTHYLKTHHNYIHIALAVLAGNK